MRSRLKNKGTATDLTELAGRLSGQGIVAQQTPMAGGKDWFGPMNPMNPVAPAEVAGRSFDYPVGYNLSPTTRQTELISFSELRNLADGYDLLRMVIETRKDQISTLKFNIVDRKTQLPDEKKGKDIEEFLKYPDKDHDWETWVRALIEDLLVIDAPCCYPRKTIGGKLYSLDLVDGATIKRIIDQSGRTPTPPYPAYSQILKGVPATEYTKEELIYRPRNFRTNRIYGYSPVEQIIATVNIAMRRQFFQLSYYTEGNIPEALISVPESWQPSQIAQFQVMWDTILSGDASSRSKVKFVPPGTTLMEPKKDAIKDEYDEWLARIICFAFSIAPGPFISDQNRATAETLQEQASKEGLLPVQNWLKNFFDYCLMFHFKEPGLEFRWCDIRDFNRERESKIVDTKLKNGTLTQNEARRLDGLPDLDDPNANKAMLYGNWILSEKIGEEKINERPSENGIVKADTPEETKPVIVHVHTPDIRQGDTYITIPDSL